MDPSFSVSVSGPCMAGSVERLMAQIQKQTGMPIQPDARAPKLEVLCGGTTGGDESYRLEITVERARLTAPGALGAMHGFATFLQLIVPGANGFAVPAMTIEDRPRFPWRGLHIDVSRHWMPVEIIKRNLDGMAAVKLNVLHWHLSDNQGFRVESKVYPKLHELGSDGLYYTQDQVRDIIAYARDRGIRVVPEFDIPGHSTSWLVGYPELAAAPGPFQIGRTWGVFDPVMDPTNEAIYSFLDKFIGEMAGLFPDEYFHIGGDEVNGKEWNANPRIAEFKRSNGIDSNEKLQAYFNRRVQPIVKKYGKKMMGWDEILAPDLPRDIVIHSWRGQKSLADAVRQGYQGILSSGYYLDLAQSAAMHYAIDPLVDPKTQKALDLTMEQRARILGGEACMWSEYVSEETIDSRIWPRTAAIAERFWSREEVKDPASMYTRMEAVSRQLEWYGLTHRSNYRPMLQRLVGAGPVEPLKVLADVVEPVKGYSRARGFAYTQQTPLNRLVDAARPESDAARHFGELVVARNYAEVREILTMWQENDARLDMSSFLLKEVAPVSKSLSALGAVGLEALDYIASGKQPAKLWRDHAVQVVEEAKKPKAELLLVVADPVQRLVNAAAR